MAKVRVNRRPLDNVLTRAAPIGVHERDGYFNAIIWRSV